jgi:hypothetical protein
MTQVAKSPLNGVKPTPEQPEVIKVIPAVKPIKQIQLPDNYELLPLEDRLHRLNELFALQGKYNRLLATKQKLAEFKLNQKTENVTLSIEDYNNRQFDFETKNPEVIAELIGFVQKSIDKRLKEIEPLLKW